MPPGFPRVESLIGKPRVPHASSKPEPVGASARDLVVCDKDTKVAASSEGGALANR